MASSDSQINKPQNGHPKRAELPDVNINTGMQSINTERASGRLGVVTQSSESEAHDMLLILQAKAVM